MHPYLEQERKAKEPVEVVSSETHAPVSHDDNEWNICVVGSSEEEAESSSSSSSGLVAPEGTKFLDYGKADEAHHDDLVKVNDGDDLAALMSQLSSLNK